MAAYTREEIEAFVSSNLEIVGEKSLAKADALRSEFVESIASLPDYHQIILIENRRLNVAADYDKVQELLNNSGNSKGGGAGGFFSSYGNNTLRSYFTHRAEGTIVWSSESRQDYRQGTIRHEESHRVDNQIGGGRFWSSSHQGFRDAVEREMETQKLRVSADAKPSNWLERQFARIFSSDSVLDRFKISGRRELLDHLSHYEGLENHIIESFAEIGNTHMYFHAKFEGDKDKIDEAMSAKFSELWPVYRDEFIPSAQKYADNLLANRDAAITKYIGLHSDLNKYKDEDFDETATSERAKILSAQGQISSETLAIQKQISIYRNPVGSYLRAQENLAEARWDLKYESDYKGRQENPFIFDEDNARVEAKAIKEKEGVDGLIARHTALLDERRALQRFQFSKDTYTRGLAEALGEDWHYPSGANILAEFDEIFTNGGLDGIEAECIRLSLPINAVNNYVRERENLEYSRWELQYADDSKAKRANPFIFNTSSVRADIETMLGPDVKENLETAAAALKEEARALSSYESRKLAFDEATSRGASKIEYSSGQDILDQFNALKSQGGMEAVRSEIERMKIPARAIESYIDAREDLEHLRWEAQNKTEVRKAANPFAFNRAAVRADIDLMLGENAKEVISAAATELRKKTRQLERELDKLEMARFDAPQTPVELRKPDVDNFRSEQLSSANWQVQRLNNPALSDSFADISEILTSADYIGGGTGPHTAHQQSGFTLRDHLGGAIGRFLSDGGLTNEQYGGMKSWQRLRGEFLDLAGDDEELMDAFYRFELDLFEQAAKTHRRVTPLAKTARVITQTDDDENSMDLSI